MASLIRKFYEAKINKYTVVTCWGSGSPLREFMHVDDLGDAIVFALQRWDPDAKDSPSIQNKPLNYLMLELERYLDKRIIRNNC